MIVSCRDKETERILKRLPSRKYQAVQDRAEERLAQLDASTELKACGWKDSEVIARVSTAFASMTNTGSALNGVTATPTMSRSWTITEERNDEQCQAAVTGSPGPYFEERIRGHGTERQRGRPGASYPRESSDGNHQRKAWHHRGYGHAAGTILWNIGTSVDESSIAV